MFHEYNLIYLQPLCICANMREHHMLIENDQSVQLR